MRYILNLFRSANKPADLKHYLNTRFPDALIPINMPNAGTYKPGARTSSVKPATLNTFKT